MTKHLMSQNLKLINHFWAEVEQTIGQLLRSQKEGGFDADSLLRGYSDTLQKLDRNLTFHFERDGENGPIEMIFGCDGFPESIQSVLSLVGAAPELEGVRFSAFTPRYEEVPEFVSVGDEVCRIDEFMFALSRVDGRLKLAIYMEEIPIVLEMDPRVEAVMMFIDALIGEYELMTKVWSLDWYEMPKGDLKDWGLRPLTQLRDVFDSLKQEARPIGMVLH